MKRNTTRGLAVALAFIPILLWAPNARSQITGEDIVFNGFISQGYINTDDVDFLVPQSRKGSAEFLEAALTVTVTPHDRLRIAAQFLARNFGDTGNDRVVLDWGYGDYRWRDALGFRAGKIKLPYGMFNEVRDLDFLRTAVFLPQSVYNEAMRDFLLAYEGVGVYGNLDLADAGDMDYHIYGGTLNVAEPDRGYWGQSFRSGAASLEPLVEAEVDDLVGEEGASRASLAAILDPKVAFPYVWGGALSWTSPLENVRLGFSLLTGRFDYSGRFRYDVWVTPSSGSGYHTPFVLDFETDQDINRIVTVSGQYDVGPLSLASEYFESEIEGTNTDGWYVLADYRVIEKAALALCYGATYDNKHDREGAYLDDYGLPRYYAWQKDWTVAARYDLTERWLLKAEFHWMDGVTDALGEELIGGDTEPLPRRWNMFAAKITFHF